MRKIRYVFLMMLLAVVGFSFIRQQKPTLYLIGDSTTHNNDKELWGWGSIIPDYFDLSKITVQNHAMAGRSTRTFVKEGRWNKVDSLLKPGDYVMMVFGHNEGSKPDTNKAGYRGVLKGTGEESVMLTWPDGTNETVHTYGWYLRKFIKDTKGKGAIPIVLSMIPRNMFKDGKVIRADNDYGKWAQEVAAQEGVIFINMNQISADKYDAFGPDSVKKFFPGDHTHTNKTGATINAQSVVEGIKANPQNPLNQYLK